MISIDHNCVNLLRNDQQYYCLTSFQVPVYTIEYENRNFRPDLHVRFHSSDPENETIRTYLWPALLEGKDGPCVQKGVVVT